MEATCQIKRALYTTKLDIDCTCQIWRVCPGLLLRVTSYSPKPFWIVQMANTHDTLPRNRHAIKPNQFSSLEYSVVIWPLPGDRILRDPMTYSQVTGEWIRLLIHESQIWRWDIPFFPTVSTIISALSSRNGGTPHSVPSLRSRVRNTARRANEWRHPIR